MRKILVGIAIVAVTLAGMCAVVHAEEGKKDRGYLIHCTSVESIKTYLDEMTLHQKDLEEVLPKLTDCKVEKISYTLGKMMFEVVRDGKVWQIIEIKDVLVYHPIPNTPLAELTTPDTPIRYVLYGSPVKGEDA